MYLCSKHTTNVVHSKFFLKRSALQIKLVRPILVHISGNRHNAERLPMTVFPCRPVEVSQAKVSFTVNPFQVVRFLTVAELLLVGVVPTVHTLSYIDTEERVTFDLHSLPFDVASLSNLLRKYFWLKSQSSILWNFGRLGTERSCKRLQTLLTM